MAEEVSRKILGIFDKASLRLKIDRGELYQGVSFDINGSSARISWEDFVRIAQRIRQRCSSNEELALIGERFVDVTSLERICRVISWIANPRALLVASHRWGGPSVFRHLDNLEVKELSKDRLQLGMRIPEPYQSCEEFFWINLGVMRSMPKLLGLAKSKVEIEINGRQCYYIVHLPKSKTVWSRLYRWIRLFSAPTAALQELSEQHQELSNRYVELEHIRDALAEANAHLEEQRAIALMEKDNAEEALLVKTEFLSTMSHELRTPLNGVYGAALALRDGDQEDRGEMLDILLNSSEQLLGFIENILQFAEMSRGELQKTDSSFCLSDVVEDTLREFLGTARHKSIDFSWTIATELPAKIISDPFRIAQVMRILIDNAMKFTEKGSIKLEVVPASEASVDGQTIEFLVSDTGVGIDKDKQEAVFDLFTQGNASASRSFGGIGLGLASAKHIAHSLGGDITFNSVPGKGTTFRFFAQVGLGEVAGSLQQSIPIIATDTIDTQASSRETSRLQEQESQSSILKETECESPKYRESPGDSVNGKTQTKTVLVVDDDATNRRILGAHLKKLGFACDFAENGQVALELAIASRYDAVFMDCEMPELNGYDATMAIRSAEGKERRTLILASTAYASANDRKRCQDAGMDGFLSKPIKRITLVRTMEQWGLIEIGGPDAKCSNAIPLALVPESPIHVLVADDNPLNRRLLARLLTKMGCEVDEFEDGTQSLAAAADRDYDAIFLDVMMPGLDGPEVAVAIRKLAEPRSRVPIIAVTAFSAQTNRERCIASGMDAFLSKPLSPRTLYSVLRQWLGDRGQQLRKSA